MSKLAEIIKTGQAPGFNTKTLDERDVDRATPRALKSLSTTDENKLIKQSGFTANHIKRTWGLLLLGALFITCELTAQDINPGYSFTPTDHVTATKLNNLVNLATINPSFISGKAAATPGASDNFLFYRSGVLYRTPFSSMGVNNTNLITDQLEDPTPALGDYLLTYDISAGALRKSQLISLVFTNDNLINARTPLFQPSQETFNLLGQESTTGAFYQINRSNLFYNCFNFVNWTNLDHLALGDTDAVTWPVNNTATGTNYQTSLNGLAGLTPVYTTNGPADYVLIMTNGALARITVANFSNAVFTAAATRKFVTPELGIPPPGTAVTNAAHGLPGTPQVIRAVLVCKTAENGYSIGDEPDLYTVVQSANGGTMWSVGCNATNVFAARSTPADAMIAKTTPAGGSAWTTNNWRIKIYAEYFP